MAVNPKSKSRITRCAEYTIIDSVGEEALPFKEIPEYLENYLGFRAESRRPSGTNNITIDSFEKDLFILYENPKNSSKDYLLHFESSHQLERWLSSVRSGGHKNVDITFIVYPGLSYAIYGYPEYKINLTGEALIKYQDHFIKKLEYDYGLERGNR